jgi:hypothetical protein
MKEIKDFIRKEFFLLFVICTSLINPYFYGYRIIALLGVYLVVNLKKSLQSVDLFVIMLGLFSLVFEVLGYFNSEEGGSTNIITNVFNVFSPVLVYLSAKVVSSKNYPTAVYAFLLFMISFSFSIIPILSVLKQISENSFLVGSRSMYLIWNQNLEISATGLGVYFTFNMASISLLFSNKKSKIEKGISIGIIVLFLLSLVCVLRLGSRTQLFISFLCICIICLKNFKYYQHYKRIIFTFSLILLIGFISRFISNNEEILFFFSDRIGSDENGFATAGGRLDRWVGSLSSLFTDPLGWPLSRFGYAHNLWLDVARVGGLLPFLILSVFSFLLVIFFYKNIFLHTSSFLRDYFIAIWVSILVVFMVEPILDGMYLFFLIHCFAAGLIVKQKSI